MKKLLLTLLLLPLSSIVSLAQDVGAPPGTLQPGTPHYFSQIDGESITYMESRIMISTHAIQYQ